jgi:predicted PurR-regulated permease PerM
MFTSQRNRAAVETADLRENRKARMDRHLWEITAVRDVFLLAVIAALIWFVVELRSVFLPVFIAIVFAYLVNPFVRLAETRFAAPRPLTVSIVILGLGLLTIGAGLWLMPMLIDQSQSLLEKIPLYVRSVSQRFNLTGKGSFWDVGNLLTRFQSDPLSMLHPLLSGTGQAFGWIGHILGTTVDIALVILLVPIYFFFFAWHFESMSRFVVRLIPLTHRSYTLHVLGRMDTAVRGFFSERLLIAMITGVLYAIGWALAEVPYWFLLGVVTGLLSLVPYLSAVGWPLAVALKYADAVTTGQSATIDWMAIVLWPSVAYLVGQFIENWILTPWLQRHSTDMSAVTILLVVFIGGAVGGLFGLIFAIPVAACIKIAIEEFVRPRWQQWVREA